MYYNNKFKPLVGLGWYIGTRRALRKYPTTTIDQQRIAGLRPDS